MAHTRQMRLGFSIGSIGYHYAAWRLLEASPDGGLSGRHHIENAQLAERGKLISCSLPTSCRTAILMIGALPGSASMRCSSWNLPLALAAIAATTKRIGRNCSPLWGTGSSK